MWGYGVPSNVAGSVCSAKSLEDMQTVVLSYLKGIGFDHMAFHLAHRGFHSDRVIALLSNYPAAWLQQYIDKDYIYHDPIHHRSLASVAPFEWRELALDAVSAKTVTLFEEAAVHGIADGFSVPLHSARTQGAFSVVPQGSFDERTRALGQGRAAVTLLAHLMHDRVLDLVGMVAKPAEAAAETLTAREKECLMWLASGKTGADIGKILKISTETANQHIHACMRKLSASTRAHAAVRGVMLGLVQPVE